MKIIFIFVFSYLIGSIPTAYLFGRLRGIDIRQHGSGNIGATNAFRVLGKGTGSLVLFLDIVKGIIATVVLPGLLRIPEQVGVYVLSGLIAVAGHNWTCFLQFKGGKGIATSLGVLIGLTIKIVSIRPVLLVTVFSWLIVFLLSGFVSLASIVAAIILPVCMVLTDQPFSLVILGAVFCVFVVLRHRANIQRLLAGKEPRVRFSSNKKQ